MMDELHEKILAQMEKDWDDRDVEGELIGKYKRLEDGRWFFHGVPGWMRHHESDLMEMCYQAGSSSSDLFGALSLLVESLKDGSLTGPFDETSFPHAEAALGRGD